MAYTPKVPWFRRDFLVSEQHLNPTEDISQSATGTVDRQKIQVHQFQRRPFPGWFSVERLFENVRNHLPDDIDVSVLVNRRPNKGFLPRLLDAFDARLASGEVNHVLGDVHYVAWFLPRRRTLITVLDCVPLERMKGVRRFVIWLLWYWWPLKRTAYVVVISEFTRQSLLKWVNYPEDKIIVIPPAVSQKFIYSRARPHHEWSRILQIGSTENKNILRIIEALEGLDVTLVMIGQLSDPVRKALETRHINYESHAHVDDEALLMHFRFADILAFPSTYEGWGMPIIEAQATGRPVVTGNVASMPEAAGDAACLVDPFDVSSIRAGFVRVLNDKAYAHALIEAGRANARKYGEKEVANRYADLYRKISEASKADRASH